MPSRQLVKSCLGPSVKLESSSLQRHWIDGSKSYTGIINLTRELPFSQSSSSTQIEELQQSPLPRDDLRIRFGKCGGNPHHHSQKGLRIPKAFHQPSPISHPWAHRPHFLGCVHEQTLSPKCVSRPDLF